MELLWAKKITKYGNRIITATAINDKLGEYITIKRYIYIQKESINNTLWTIFQEKLYGFTTNDFKRICFKLKVKLQIHLLKRGVYITIYNNRYTLSEVLFDLL